MDAFISTRIHDIPTLQYKTRGSSGGIASMLKSAVNLASTGTNITVGSSAANKLPIVNEIDHYILTTSLGIGYPFSAKPSSGDEKCWFKG
jgi:hypothetical protein